MRAIGIAIPFIRRRSGAAIDAQAQAHYDRVIADGGVLPSGLGGVNSFFQVVKTIYATSDITTAISVGLDAQVLGYKLGAGAGTTLGQAAQKLYSCSGASGDVVQTTAASQPLLLVHSGENYWFGSGVSGNDVTTPDAVANRFTGNIEYIVKCKFIKPLDNIGVSKYSGTNINSGFSWSINSSTFNAYYAIGSTAHQITFATSAFPALNTDVFIKVIRNSSTGLVTASFSTNGTSYTIIGSLTGQTGAINGGSVPLCASTTTLTGGNQGYTYRATISNLIGGSPVVDFNPNQYNAANSQTQWTSSTGEVWTINISAATTGYKGVLVNRTIMQFDGQNARLTGNSSTITNTITQKFGIAAVFSRYTTSTNDFMFNIGGDYGNINTAGLGCLTNPTPYLFTQGTVLALNNSSNNQVLNKLTAISTYANYRVSNGSVIFMDSIQTNFTINNTTNVPVAPASTFGICNSGFSNLNGCINTLILTNNGTKFVEINDYIKQINNI